MSLSDLVAYFNLRCASLCAHGSTFNPLSSTDSTPFTQASSEARRTLASLGRFAYPAFTSVLAKVNPQPGEAAALVALLSAVPGAN